MAIGPLLPYADQIALARRAGLGWAKAPAPPERDCTIIAGIARVAG